MSFSDYSSHTSGYVSESDTPWGVWSPAQLQKSDAVGRPSSSSFADVNVGGSLDAVREEFRMNGTDSPYYPELEAINANQNKNVTALPGMGPPGIYLRQKSYPAPDSSPHHALPQRGNYKRHSADETMLTAMRAQAEADKSVLSAGITEQQMQALDSLPNSVLYYLLQEVAQKRISRDVKPAKVENMECRFCKNNGESPAYYRSHWLRWRGRVLCPVLRAYRCERCGASGDSAHTLKYCPLTTEQERKNAGVLMRSIRMSSGRRRRNAQVPSSGVAGNYVVFGETTPSVTTDGVTYNDYNSYNMPLDPDWEALAMKLTL